MKLTFNDGTVLDFYPSKEEDNKGSLPGVKIGTNCLICGKFVELDKKDIPIVEQGYLVYKVCHSCKEAVAKAKLL